MKIKQVKIHKEVKQEILNLLQKEWVDGGDQRLFQFLFNNTNLREGYNRLDEKVYICDPYYNTDEDTLKYLEQIEFNK